MACYTSRVRLARSFERISIDSVRHIVVKKSFIDIVNQGRVIAFHLAAWTSRLPQTKKPKFLAQNFINFGPKFWDTLKISLCMWAQPAGAGTILQNFGFC